MKNISNTIFLDTISVLFPKKLSFLEECNGTKDNKIIDGLAVNVLNHINKENTFNIVLLDKELELENNEIEKVMTSYGIKAQLHQNWYLNYSETLQSPFDSISKWLSEHRTDNYIVLLSSKYQFELDFNDTSDVNFNYIHFIDEDNGISLKNLHEIQQSLKLWI